MIAVIDRDRLTAYGMALLLRDWGYDSVVGVSAADIFSRSEAAGRPLAAIVADERGAGSASIGFATQASHDGRAEAAVLARLARRKIPTVVLVSSSAEDGDGETGPDRVTSLPKPVEPNVLRELLRHLTAKAA